MIKKLRIRVLPIILIIVILLSSMGAAFAKPIKTYSATANGITYTVQTWKSGNKEHITVRTDKDPDYLELIVNTTNKTINKENYDYKGKGLFGERKYDKKSETIDCSVYENPDANNVSLQSITWQKKYYESWKNDYWYMRGTDISKTYIRIGCVATYEIRRDTLTDYNNTQIDTYTSAILASRAAMNKAIAADGLGILACVAGIVACMIFMPIGLIIAAVVGACGGGAELVYFLVDSYNQYEIAKDQYGAIKALGRKL